VRPALSRRTASAVAVAVIVAVTATAVVLWAPWRERVGTPLDPVTRFTQDANGVHVFVHNPNKHWGLRHQHVSIVLHDNRDGFNILRTYGPDEDDEAPDPGDNRTIHCCEITLLPPGGDYRFDLWPSRRTVAGISIRNARHSEGWVRM
jgi:hypothetical protein